MNKDNSTISRIEIKVNGKKTPLTIGDRVFFGPEDKEVRYVVSLKIDETGCIMYLVEWVTNMEIKTQWVSNTELKIFNDINRKKRSTIGF